MTLVCGSYFFFNNSIQWDVLNFLCGKLKIHHEEHEEKREFFFVFFVTFVVQNDF